MTASPLRCPGADSCRLMAGLSFREVILLIPAPPRPVPALKRGALEVSEYGERVDDDAYDEPVLRPAPKDE